MVLSSIRTGVGLLYRELRRGFVDGVRKQSQTCSLLAEAMRTGSPRVPCEDGGGED